MKYGSLFSGIGGIDLGFDRAGMECVWQVEIDDYATKVLEKHWPEVHREKDIRECGKHNLESVDVIAGGFPCQDISYAGRGAGLDGERSGLFFEAVRVVRELQPRYVVLENVAALLTRGLDRVLGTLAEIGYDAEWHCIPAAAVGAPHIRDRVFVLAYAESERHRGWREPRNVCEAECRSNDELLREPSCSSQRTSNVSNANSGRFKECQKCDGESESWKQTQQRNYAVRLCNDVAYSNMQHGERWIQSRQSEREERKAWTEPGGSGSDVADAYSSGFKNAGECEEVSKCGWQRTFGSSSWWDAEPDVGRVANGVPNRVDRLRGLGNAVVPQVSEWIGRRLMQFEMEE